MKVLVANRGEIAIRVLRACQEMGIRSAAIYTDVDESALHIRYADEALPIGPRQNYLNIDAVVAAAKKCEATAIHPGYGFLAENADFAQAVEDAGITFIGPRPETIALMGDKLASRKFARELGLPVLPGTDNPLPIEVPAEMAEQVAYPVMVKATAGGGGRGIRLAFCAEELLGVIEEARKEALAAFGDDTVYLESMVQKARHIEVQILGDGQGKVVCLGERECSIQRRRQKLIEEAPAPNLSWRLRHQLYDAAARLGKGLNYRGLGTVEFLLDEESNIHFIEVNPRIQVEHPVTEMVTGVDLVQEQLRLAMGEPLRYDQDYLPMRGSAIEARVLAEDTRQGFLPTTGQITYLKEPGGPGVRVDSALYQGYQVTSEYDSMLAKVITWGEDRPAAIRRMKRALHEYQIGSIATSVEFLLQILDSQSFTAGKVTTTYLEEFNPEPPQPEIQLEKELALAAALYAHNQRLHQNSRTFRTASGWQTVAWQEQMKGRN